MTAILNLRLLRGVTDQPALPPSQRLTNTHTPCSVLGTECLTTLMTTLRCRDDQVGLIFQMKKLRLHGGKPAAEVTQTLRPESQATTQVSQPPPAECSAVLCVHPQRQGARHPPQSHLPVSTLDTSLLYKASIHCLSIGRHLRRQAIPWPAEALPLR